MRKNKDYKILLIIVLAILVFIGVIFSLLAFNKTTEISGQKEPIDSKYLNCTTSISKDYPLIPRDESDIKYSSSIKFINNRISSVTFEISKHFSKQETAESFTNMVHANFDIYIGDHRIDRDEITPTYTSVDNISKITLFLEKNAVNNKTAPLVMIGLDYLNSDSIDEIMENYNNKDYNCKIMD